MCKATLQNHVNTIRTNDLNVSDCLIELLIVLILSVLANTSLVQSTCRGQFKGNHCCSRVPITKMKFIYLSGAEK